ncbi:hypothetical protein MBANPS3_002504 [Mucor bainieri]
MLGHLAVCRILFRCQLKNSKLAIYNVRYNYKADFDRARSGLANYIERSGLKNRWSTIKKLLLSKFAGYIDQAQRHPASGINGGMDVAVKANERYCEESRRINQKPFRFQFMHCYTILEKETKWRSSIESEKEASPLQPSNRRNPDDEDDDDNDARLMGRKQAIGKRKAEAVLEKSQGKVYVTMAASMNEWSELNKKKQN